MSVRDVIQAAAGGVTTESLYSDSVFSTYLYTGNGSTQTINNGIDLAGKGGMVWLKQRQLSDDHYLFDTARGTNYLCSDLSQGQLNGISYLSSFNSNGFTVGANASPNNFGVVSWTFRKAPKFFDVQTATKSAGVSTNISFSDLGTLGMVVVKRTDSTGDWFVWHKSLSAGKLLYLNQTAAEATLGHVTVSGTTVTLVNGVIADGSYVVYAWAHDTASDGLIQCGSFTPDGSGNATVNLGWEPQWLLTKNASGTDNGRIQDSMRNMSHGGNAVLYPSTSVAEIAGGAVFVPTATGFTVSGMAPSSTYIYLAIRRPNKPPTTGTQVYNAVARTGTGAATTSTAGFPVDLVITKKRSSTTLTGAKWVDRLRGKTITLDSTAVTDDTTVAQSITALDLMTGVSIGTDGSYNTSTHTYVDWFFRRYPEVFDVVCDTGTGAAHNIAHNLGVAPEMLIRKGRSGGSQWEVWHSALASTDKIVLSGAGAKSTYPNAWNSTSPSASSFTVGIGSSVNTNAATYVTYLFATKAGISKVFSFTGNGTSLNIECGFSSGARFILLKRTDSTGAWLVADTTRGIVSAADPSLALNSTAAEVTTADWVDPYTGGFTVVQETTNNANVNNATYIGIAFS